MGTGNRRYVRFFDWYDDWQGHRYVFDLHGPRLPPVGANRIQGLWANENAIQRFVLFADGLQLFRSSPIYGLGMGAFENGVKSVQSFDYIAKYAHNHYIQTLAETGVIGLISDDAKAHADRVSG